jgi:hypothetical protein
MVKSVPTPAEIRFQIYGDEGGYGFDFEPDWNSEFGSSFRKKPDFLARSGPAIFEVREFETQAKTRFQEEHNLWNEPISPIVTRKPLFYGIKEKAKQLEEFSVTGLPLIIGLTNPRGADVSLQPPELIATMFGAPTSVTASAWHVESTVATRLSHEPGYGVFCGTDSDGQPTNRWPHISGIAVLTHGVDYYDLAGYRLGSGSAVPNDWFTGPHDRRFRFEKNGITFGPA